jgi:3-oxoacyl-[acyl-carrier protein] reductase
MNLVDLFPLPRPLPRGAEKRFMRENRPTSLIERLIAPKEIADFVPT